MTKIIKNPILIVLYICFFSACTNISHYALGPVEELDDDNLPIGMFAPGADKRSDSQLYVISILANDIEKTKHNPPEMLRGLAYLEFVLNDISSDVGITIDTKESVKLIVLNLREALGIPLESRPSEVIEMYWSTAKFLEISKFTEIKVDQSEIETQEKLSEVKSAITRAVIKAKLNLITEKNSRISKKIGGKKLEYAEPIIASAEKISFSNFRAISFSANDNPPPQVSKKSAEDLERNLTEILNIIVENRDYFSKLKQTYEKDLFETTEAVFDKLTKEKHDYWLTINRLQRLSDFLAITSFKLSERLKVEPREVKEVELKLRNLTSFDVNNVKNFLSKFKTEKINRLVTFQKAYTQKTPYIVPAVFHVDRHKIGLNDLLKEVYNLPVDRISLLSKMLSQSAKDITSISTDLQNLSRDVIDSTKEFADVSSQLSYVAGQYLASLNTDLQTIANTIATAVQSGISADLDSLAQGFGFGSFADAVAAYNAAYGTNYSVQEARDALAGK